MGSSAGFGRRALIVVGMTLGSGCLICCGGPTIAYFAIKHALNAPTTSKPLTPNELVRWNLGNKPSQPVVLYDPTQRDVELIVIVREANTGAQLRQPGSTDKFRQPTNDLFLQHYETSPLSGKAQLIFQGEQANQEVVCWFETADSIQNITLGDEVVVRGRRIYIGSTVSGGKGPFVLELIGCRLIRD